MRLVVIISAVVSLLCSEILFAEEVVLSVRSDERPNERAPSFRLRTTSIEPDSLKNIPDFRYSSFVSVKFGGKTYYGVFMLDGAGRYRRLLFDTDGDGDLKDEQEIRGRKDRDGSVIIKTFEVKDIKLSFNGRRVERAGLFFITTGNSIYCVVKINWYWYSRIVVGGDEYPVYVFDSDVDGSLADERFVWIDFGRDGRLGGSDMVPLGVPLLYGREKLTFKLEDGNGTPTLSCRGVEQKGYRNVKSPYEGMLILEKEEVVYVHTYKGEFYLPKEGGRVGLVILSKRSEDGAIWDLTYTVGRDLNRDEELPTPEPLIYELRVRPSRGSSFIFSLKTSKSVREAVLYRNGRRLGRPSVVVKDEEGNLLHNFKFNYG